MENQKMVSSSNDQLADLPEKSLSDQPRVNRTRNNISKTSSGYGSCSSSSDKEDEEPLFVSFTQAACKQLQAHERRENRAFSLPTALHDDEEGDGSSTDEECCNERKDTMTYVKSEVDLDTKIFRESHFQPSRHVLVKARQFQTKVAVLEKEKHIMERLKDYDIPALEIMLSEVSDTQKEEKSAIRRRITDIKRQKQDSLCQIATKARKSRSESVQMGDNVKSARPVNRNPASIKEALLRWCQAMTKEYKNIEIRNFSSHWADGLAFCAIVHHFFPAAFDFTQLSSENRRANFELAFRVAQEQADVDPLLDVEDMILMGDKPDWKCVFCYVQSLYKHFKDR